MSDKEALSFSLSLSLLRWLLGSKRTGLTKQSSGRAVLASERDSGKSRLSLSSSCLAFMCARCVCFLLLLSLQPFSLAHSLSIAGASERSRESANAARLRRVSARFLLILPSLSSLTRAASVSPSVHFHFDSPLSLPPSSPAALLLCLRVDVDVCVCGFV